MTIKELINELQKYPNQNAEINIVTNLIDIDNEAFDCDDCKIDFLQQDVDNQEMYDLYISKENKSTEPRIHELLELYDNVTIKLDTKDNYGNIVILSENNDVLREIQVGGRHYQADNITIMLSNIL